MTVSVALFVVINSCKRFTADGSIIGVLHRPLLQFPSYLSLEGSATVAHMFPQQQDRAKSFPFVVNATARQHTFDRLRRPQSLPVLSLLGQIYLFEFVDEGNRETYMGEHFNP
jgi:hypothetical protein